MATLNLEQLMKTKTDIFQIHFQMKSKVWINTL